MKATIMSTEGQKKSDTELPRFFSTTIRPDLILRAFKSEIAAERQAYGTAKMAGKRASAPGKIRHKRRAYKTAYGYGISRVPRKVLTRRGRRFYWQGAFSPNTVGGRKAHPAKPDKIWDLKINKKEYVQAFKCAIAATISKEFIKEKYNLNEDALTFTLPLIVERRIEELNKIKDVKKVLSALIKTDAFFPKRKVRAGKGTMRGRRHKKTAGLLLVVSKVGKLKSTKAFDIKEAKELTIRDLSPGGKPGRITIYSHAAISELENKFKPKFKEDKK